MLALLVLLLISTVIASPTPRLQGYNYEYPRNSAGNDMYSQVRTNLEGKIKESCDKYGEASSFNNYIKVKDTFKKNLTAAAFAQASDLIQRREHPDKVRIFCGLKATFKTGLVNMETALRPCVHNKAREHLKRAPEIADSFFKYICFNEGEKVNSFINKGGVECVKEHKTKISECVVQVFGDKIKTLESEVPSNHIYDSYEVFNEEREEQKKRNRCQPLLDLKTCVKNELDKCPSQSSSTFVTGLLDSIMTTICQ